MERVRIKEKQPGLERVRIRVREESPERVTVKDRPLLTPEERETLGRPRKAVLLAEVGQLLTVEFNENIVAVQPLRDGGRVLVTYSPKRRITPAKYFAHLRPDGVIEIIPSTVMRPKEV